MENCELIGLYCSDVSGAFDRVRRSRLIAKLRASGLHPRVVRFLASWLEDRKSVVLVCGAQTAESLLANSVFQGTVLGPPLWNMFYVDAAQAVRCLEFTEVVFADDFNSWRGFPAGTSIDEIWAHCAQCQEYLHGWGVANSVKFDPSKESFHVLHRTRGYGDGFLLLGLHFDESLHMNVAASIIGREAGWRLQSVLRPKRFFSRNETMNLYKSQVLSYIESSIPGYYHAATTVLAPIDRVQRRLLRELALSEEVALERYKLAPLSARRDMAMLGLLHRVVLGEVSEQLRALFPIRPFTTDTTRPTTRLDVRRHKFQFVEPTFHTDVLKRSIFGLTVVYNLLPSKVVESKSIKSFQSLLQLALRRAAANGIENWQRIFAPDWRPLRAAALQALFR